METFHTLPYASIAHVAVPAEVRVGTEGQPAISDAQSPSSYVRLLLLDAFMAQTPPRIKVRKGGKGSSTKRQIGMLLRNF